MDSGSASKMGSDYCKSLHPSSILGQASTFSLGKRPVPAILARAETERNGVVWDSSSRPTPKLSSSIVSWREALARDAYRDGERTGLLGILNYISNPERKEQVRAAIEAAPNLEAARQAARAALWANRNEAQGELANIETEMGRLERVAGALQEIVAWMEAGPKLEAAKESAFHKVYEEGVLTTQMEYHAPPVEIEAAREGCGVFLIQHDWQAAFQHAQIDSGDIRLPFEHCCFEFVFSGRRVCALYSSRDGIPYQMLPLIRTSVGWVLSAPLRPDGDGWAPIEGSQSERSVQLLAEEISAQVRAAAISLDAEVVRAEIIRAPHRLNAARERRGAIPIYDHHVLSLARARRGAEPLSTPTAAHRKRCHFRRGHWRHYPSHKTWIRWMLVGDPALGFRDKDYRL